LYQAGPLHLPNPAASQRNAMGDRAPLRLVVSQGLAERIIDIQHAASSSGGSGGSVAPAQRQDAHGQLLRTSATSELNRQQFSQTQHAMAAGLLERAFVSSIVALVVVMLFILATRCVGLYLFVQGWITFAKFQKLPCDQPLASWLLAMLLFIPVSDVLDRLVVKHTRPRPEDEQPFQVFSPAAQRFKVVVMIARGGLIVFGFCLHGQSTTCTTTNEQLYHFVHMYLVFNVVLCFVKALVMCASMRLVLFLARHNAELFGGPGEHRAARPGLINELETVTYDSTLFSDTDADKEPPECCICQGSFAEGGLPIKRVPCCGHHFHEPCLGSWIGSYARTCPLCRMDLEDVVGERGAAAIP